MLPKKYRKSKKKYKIVYAFTNRCKPCMEKLPLIVNFAKEQAIKEYEANKAIEATKQGAVVSQGSDSYDLNSDKLPTYEQIANMSDAEYAKAYEKYGDKLLTVS